MGNAKVDVLVIGGGPAGSSLAGHLARQGVRVLVVEGKKFPREHIGESLLAVSMPILADLGVAPELEAGGLPRKLGAVFVWGPTDQPMTLRMPEPGYAFQVRRAEFDDLLLRHAGKLGAHVWQERWIKEPVWDDSGRMCGAVVAGPGDRPQTVFARFVVDASGLFQFLPKKLGLPISTFGPRRVALTAYYTGALRYDQPYADDIISEACQDGWIWFIPLDDHTTSVGFVGDEGDLVGAPQDALELQVATSTLTKQLIAPATLARPAKVRKYTNHTVESPLWTNGYLLVGDTAIFVDPLFSTGVHGSLHSSANAAAGIVSVLEGTLAEDRVAAWFDHTFRSHYGRVREMIRLLYGLHPGNSRFWRNRTLSRIGEEDAEDLVRSIGVAGLDFFAMTGDSLALPEPLRRRIGTNSYRPTSAALPMDSVLDLADEAELEPTLMRSGGRLVPSIILRHRRSRTQEYEFAEHGGLHRLLLALDGERDLQSAVAAVNGDATDQDKIALFVGELVSCGLLDPVG